MQIYELNRRRTDEGAMWDAVKTSVGHAVADATGQDRQPAAASAGILDPKQKLAAVMKEPQMVKLATDYAKEWLATQPKPVAEEVGTYNKKTGAAKLGGKSMTALSDLPPAMQQQILAKQQATAPGPSSVAGKPAAGKPAVPAVGVNANNVMNLPGMQKYAAPAAGTQPQPSTTGSRINKADPSNPNINDQTRYVQGRTGSGPGSAATKFAKYDPATSSMANAEQGINNLAKGGVAARQLSAAAPAKSTGTAMPLKPFQVPGAGTNPAPVTPVATANKTAVPPGDPATAEYLKDFLEFANKKIAIRDPSTYKMIGLTAVENSTEKDNLRAELDAAKEKVVAARGNPAATESAVKNYILTAMAGAQLIASQNRVAAASPEAPAYGQQQSAAATSSSKAAAATAPTSGQLTGTNAVALLNKVGLPAKVLTPAGQAIQSATGNRQLSATGDLVIDTMLEGMGYTVS